ncbi:MAG: glucose-6-phosphate isomerase, partial [Dehalococcoidia bacterium]
IGITPFDQPNVQEAKDATNGILSGAEFEERTGPVSDVLDAVGPGDYIAILAYIPRTAEHDRALQAARVRLRDRYRVATTIGYGPRFLHSTGQLHKGGPDTGVFIQIVGDDPHDLEIPGAPYTFGQLKHAQALGDLESLRSHGRRVARATLEEIVGMGT